MSLTRLRQSGFGGVPGQSPSGRYEALPDTPFWSGWDGLAGYGRGVVTVATKHSYLRGWVGKIGGKDVEEEVPWLVDTILLLS